MKETHVEVILSSIEMCFTGETEGGRQERDQRNNTLASHIFFLLIFPFPFSSKPLQLVTMPFIGLSLA